MKDAVVATHREQFSIEPMCRLLEVARSGYYAWCERQPSQRAQERAHLMTDITTSYRMSRATCGSPRVSGGCLLPGGEAALSQSRFAASFRSR
ncbi:MAG: hypothetical protein HZC41_24445 [Chloroflexi bacterium]|nr:hypothetical protein [Chloroflexota bacterium]